MIKKTKIQNLQRFKEIIEVLLKYDLLDFFDNTALGPYIDFTQKVSNKFKKSKNNSNKKTLSVRLRLAIEELGPTFIKLGQVLSTRVDILPKEYIKELSKLQNNVSTIEFPAIEKQIKNAFKKDIKDLFAKFYKRPLAAASLSQVHKAVLKDETEVIVKIQRPNIKDKIEKDLQILYFLAGIFENNFSKGSLYQPVDIISQFDKTIHEELDFVRESYNIKTFYNNFNDFDTIIIPKIYQEFVADKVIVADYISGIKISEIQNNSQNIQIDTSSLGKIIAQAFLKQIFIDGFFHADPHPGNILLTDKGVALLDFGMVGRLDEEDKEILSSMMRALVNKDSKSIIKGMEDLDIVTPKIDKKKLTLDINDLIDSYYNMPLEHIHLEELIPRLLNIMMNNKIKMPVNFVLLMRSLITLEGVVFNIDPKLCLIVEIKNFLGDLYLKKLNPEEIIKKITRNSNQIFNQIKTFPKNITTFMESISKGRFNLHLTHEKVEELIDVIDKSSNQISMGLIIGSLILGSSFIIHLDKGPYLFGYSALGVIGFFLSGFLGIFLVISILRKRKY